MLGLGSSHLKMENQMEPRMENDRKYCQKVSIGILARMAVPDDFYDSSTGYLTETSNSY